MEQRPGSVEIHELLEHAGWARALARSLVRDPNSADDALQETWLAALDSPPSDRRNLRGWLARTLGNAARERARSERRREAREQEGDPHEPVPTPQELAQRLEMQRILAGEVAALPEPFRSTLLLRYYEGRTGADIAKLLGLPQGTVRWRIHEALERLRTRLDERHGGREPWVGALLPLARGSVVPGTGVGVLAGVLMMKFPTMVTVGLLVVASLAGLAAWRSTRSEGSAGAAPARVAESMDARDSDATHATNMSSGDASSSREALGATAPAWLTLSGCVIDLPCAELGWSRAPAVGVSVRLRLDGIEDAGGVQTQTDGQGRFFFVLPAGRGGARGGSVSAVEDDDYRGASAIVRMDTSSLAAELMLERPPHGVLEGHTVDQSGRPLAGVALRFPERTGERSVISDALGSFRLERYRGSSSRACSARKDGFRVAVPPEPRAIDCGSWEPLRIDMLPAGGRIGIALRRSTGEPRLDVRGQVSLAPSEPLAGRSWILSGFQPEPELPELKCDAGGRLVFEDVWRDRKLQIRLQDDRHRWSFERLANAELVFGSATGEPIVVSGQDLELQVQLPEDVHLQGMVVHADGTPVARATVELSDVDVPASGEAGIGAALTTDERGRFEQDLRPSRFPFRGLIRAADGPLTQGSGFDWDAKPAELRAPYRAAVSEYLTLEPADAGATRTVRLVLQPALQIRGRVLNAEGEGCGFRVTAVACGTSSRRQARTALVESGGVFEVEGLAPGDYDLLVDLEKATALESEGFALSTTPFAPERFSNIPAGSEQLCLRVAPHPLVDVTVEARSRTCECRRLLVVLGRYFPGDALESTVPLAPSDASYADRAGWPASQVVIGGSGERDEHGQWSFTSLVEPGSSFRWPPLAEGRYWFGVCASASKDDPWSYTEGTGWLDFKPGKYHFVFDVVPPADLRGSVLGANSDHALCVALADESGKLLRVERNDAMIGTISTSGADGSFLIRQAPTGRWRLRAGHEADLRAGRFLAEREIEIGSGSTAPVEIRVP